MWLFYILIPALFIESPHFLSLMLWTSMNPLVSVGWNVPSPISSILDSAMSYSFSVSELRPRT